MFFYAGVGSRRTPPIVLGHMTIVAAWLREQGGVLRSGGATGADTAFWNGSDHATSQVFRPHHATPAMMDLAARYHPAWGAIRSEYVRQLHARNCAQVLGENLDSPSAFVICWTPDGATTTTSQATGGTGQAIRVAVGHNIPVINMAVRGWKQRLITLVESL